ncbi:Glycosyltransferase [Musa troglodytarum]|uniref:Glycosyltransferase n=2 Tax=Musa troglodytarum TaxID=320322 RepID=A0A9E7IA54_9LILI|nr:Glycosyltransferase [Musa troglodytarum]
MASSGKASRLSHMRKCGMNCGGNSRRIVTQKLGLLLLTACCIILLRYSFSLSECSRRAIRELEPHGDPICDLDNPRTDFCEMDGDVRVVGKSSVVVVTHRHPRNAWRVKPYARKADPTAMANVKEVSVRLTGSAEAAPACAINHTVPAVVFAHGGYMGNYFHDFADLIVPLFATARQFHGEVQFLIADYKIWWLFKYRNIVEKLTRYEIIDLDKKDRVLCYPHVLIGLHSHDDLKVDSARTPNGYSTADYTKFIRMAYSLKRESAIRMGEQAGEKPRLLLIARKGTRKFTNVKEIVRMAEELSYEVVVADAKFEANVSEYAATVNSCDVMLGVHGSGLTNFFFLPTNAVVIQVVPLGNLEGMAKYDYGDPPMAAELHYLQYTISQEESTLSEQYPRDDPVQTCPEEGSRSAPVMAMPVASIAVVRSHQPGGGTMASKLRLTRNANQPRRFRFVLLILGCLVVTVTFLVVSKPQALVLPKLGFTPSLPPPPSDHDAVNGDDHGTQGAAHSEESLQGEKKEMVVDATPKEDTSLHELTEESGARADDLNSNQDETRERLTLPTVSNYTIDDRPQAAGEKSQAPKRKPLCDVSDRRADICEMDGDIRISGSSSSVVLMESPRTEETEIWHVHPYPRKGDEACLKGVRKLEVKASSEASPCTVNHDAPAVVFSTGGYTGNLFHDYSDLLVPLFLTARPFDGEVKLVVTDSKSWWITKYLLVLQKLSKYPVIDLDMDKEVHCFKQVTVGLRAHNEFHIDPERSPNGYTMIDFAKFMRSAFSSEREALLNIEDLAARKPRLLIVGRKQSRVLTNTKEIVEMAEELGFEVVVEEADAGSDLARVGRTVNSCDVMVGVHGTGLTNSVFLPMNAILIQIVPWGRLESKAMQDYGNPAKEMGLGYLEYSIAIEESSLREKYPRDHPVFTDPLSFHSRGYHVMRATFMDDQNVKLDVRKFKEVLWKALEHLIQ